MDQLKSRHASLSSKLSETDVEAICSFINDADILQVGSMDIFNKAWSWGGGLIYMCLHLK